MIQFCVPGLPPSKSNSYRSGRGYFFKSSKVVTYENAFRVATLEVKKHTFGEKDRLEFCIGWFPPHLKSDIDGICKVLLDCCQKTGIIWNDNKIDRLHVVRFGVDKVNPRVEIEISKID